MCDSCGKQRKLYDYEDIRVCAACKKGLEALDKEWQDKLED